MLGMIYSMAISCEKENTLLTNVIDIFEFLSSYEFEL